MTLSADAGDPVATRLLGIALLRGWSGRADRDKAYRRFHDAAEAGDRLSMKLVGEAYELGDPLPQDYEKAVYWTKRAADNGDADAHFRLARLYAKGMGVPRSLEEADRLAEIAANMGNPPAQLSLGIASSNGERFEKDNVQAYKWVMLCLREDLDRDLGSLNENGTEMALRLKKHLELAMTPEQIAEATQLAEEWRVEYAANQSR